MLRNDAVGVSTGIFNLPTFKTAPKSSANTVVGRLDTPFLSFSEEAGEAAMGLR